MKSFATTVLGLLFSFSAIAAGNIGQCVYPKTTQAKDGSLKFKNTVYIFRNPNSRSDKVALTTFEAFTIGAEAKGGFIQLIATPGWDTPPNENAGKLIGWAKLSDFDFQELRNCN
ncbi:hypothetical protein [Methylomicrobium agile]|uniref:hypothetical protein n=1 Tax=Methylomicrobium agile TaxID=39774 RepID=UPI0004DF9D63|nr:hypothetical protein [Methylomicrobium agile]